MGASEDLRLACPLKKPRLNLLGTSRSRLQLVALFLFATIVLALFCYVSVEIMEGRIGEASWVSVDNALLSFIRDFRSLELTRFFKSISDVGSVPIICLASVASCVYFYLRRDASNGRLVLLSSILSGAAVWIVKSVVRRHRPSSADWLVAVDSFSFPSGHTTASVAIYGTIFLTLGLSTQRSSVRYSYWLFGSILIVLVAFSRMYLGVHFPTDVLGGGLLGISLLLYASFMNALFEALKRQTLDQSLESR